MFVLIAAALSPHLSSPLFTLSVIESKLRTEAAELTPSPFSFKHMNKRLRIM